MTQQFENFVNAALDKSLASDVTLPTADDIPVFTGIGRQVTGKTKAELGLATSSQLTDKADLVEGLVPAYQLPGYVDDVLEYANLASFPLLGEASKLYIAIDTNLVYRWGGSTYAVTSSSLALGENSSTAYRGDRGKTAYDHSQATGNPHGTTATNLGLGNVNNTSDADKPISTVTQTALNGKEPTLANVITANTYGSATQYPVITFNAKGIATGVTLQTVVSPAVFSDSDFRIQDNDDATKQIAFEVSGVDAGATRTITMPDANVNLGLIGSVPAYVNGAAYIVGNEVTYLGILYICGTAHTSNTGSPDLTKFYPASGASNLDIYDLTGYKENYVASTGIRKVFKQYASTFPHTGDKTMTVDIVLGNNISWYNNGISRLYNIKVMAYRDDGSAPRSGALIMDKRVIVARGTESSANIINGIPLLEDIKTYLFGMFSASTFTANIINSGGSYHLILTLTCPNIITTVSAIMLVETISCD